VEYSLGKFSKDEALAEMTAKGEISMNSTAKTIAFWVALLVTVVLLYNVFSRPSDGRVTEYSFSKFLDEVDHKNVKSARIVDSELTGQLISGGSFRTIVPEDYPALYDRLQGVDVKIEHATPNPWLSAFVSWAPFLFIIGFWIYFMRKFQRKGTLRTGDTDVPNLGEANVVHLDPDVAKAFPNARSVNEALRLVIQLKDIPGTA
jgi:cell division protease FtsH